MSPEENKEEISPAALKTFLKHVCIVSKKYYDREKARKELKSHIDKIKKSPSIKKKSFLEKELRVLDTKLNNVLEKEAQLIGMERHGSISIAELKRKIDEMQKELIAVKCERDELQKSKEILENFNRSLSGMKGRIDGFINDKGEREARIKELEAKIRNTPKEKNKAIVMRKHLDMLEKKYAHMIASRKYSRNDLSRIGSKIESLKSYLDR